MPRVFSILVCGAVVSLLAPASDPAGFPAVRVLRIPIGQSTITLVRTGQADARRVIYFSPHANETTAREACFRHIRTHGGIFFALENSGRRNLRFRVAGRYYRIDPNRIFTRTGASGSLDRLNGRRWRNNQSAVLKAVLTAGRRILAHMADAEAIVAVHNNRHDTARTFGRDPLVSRILWPPGVADTHDFYYATREPDARFLHARGFAVVAQDPRKAQGSEGDGSFGAYCGQKGIRYINVETAPGKLALQERMLAIAWECLARSSGT